MLTVVSFEEFSNLHRDRKLLKSENFEFVAPSTQSFLGKVFKEEKEADMSQIIYLHSVAGVETTEVSKEVLEDSDDGILAFLPLLEDEQILIVTKPNEKVMLFSDSSLDEIESSTLSTEEEQEFYKEILLEKLSGDEACVYAVSTPITLDSVVAVLYPEELEEKMAAIKEASKGRDVLFSTTEMFS